MAAHCEATLRSGVGCNFYARIHATDGKWYCRMHNNMLQRAGGSLRPRTGRVTTLAHLRCAGIAKRTGAPCKRYGSKCWNGVGYCNNHVPDDYIDLTAEPQRPIVQYGDISVDVEDECPICYKQLKYETIVKTNCGHAFHQGCIDRWLQTVTQCPMCRTTTHIRRKKTHRIEVVEYE